MNELCEPWRKLCRTCPVTLSHEQFVVLRVQNKLPADWTNQTSYCRTPNGKRLAVCIHPDLVNLDEGLYQQSASEAPPLTDMTDRREDHVNSITCLGRFVNGVLVEP